MFMEEDRFGTEGMEGFVGEKEEFVGDVLVWCAAGLKFCANWSLSGRCWGTWNRTPLQLSRPGLINAWLWVSATDCVV